MINPSLDPVGAFDEAIPWPAQRDILRVLIEAYPRAFRATEELVELPEIDDLWRGVRRGMIEGGMRRVARKHGLTARVEANRSRNNHTVIEGGNFFLTISAVGDPSERIRPAQFRVPTRCTTSPSSQPFKRRSRPTTGRGTTLS